jgi:hypothetical protein
VHFGALNARGEDAIVAYFTVRDAMIVSLIIHNTPAD